MNGLKRATSSRALARTMGRRGRRRPPSSPPSGIRTFCGRRRLRTSGGARAAGGIVLWRWQGERTAGPAEAAPQSIAFRLHSGRRRSPRRDPGTARRSCRAGLCWPLPERIGDAELEAALYANRRSKRGHRRHAEPDWPAVHRELKRKDVTLLIVWDEYIAANGQRFHVGDELPALRFGLRRRLHKGSPDASALMSINARGSRRPIVPQSKKREKTWTSSGSDVSPAHRSSGSR